MKKYELGRLARHTAETREVQDCWAMLGSCRIKKIKNNNTKNKRSSSSRSSSRKRSKVSGSKEQKGQELAKPFEENQERSQRAIGRERNIGGT